jgi:hypothetical protein
MKCPQSEGLNTIWAINMGIPCFLKKTIKYMKIIVTNILLWAFCIHAFAQDPAYPPVTPAPLQIIKAEYFIDEDPGFGMATDIPLVAGLDIPNLTATVGLTGLASGSHNLIVRTLNAEGQWSLTSVIPFGIDPDYPIATPAPQNIVKAEYFIANDPGFGLATDIPLTAATQIPNLVATVNLNGLTSGAYNLYLRSLNTEGEWSITSLKTFGIDPSYPSIIAAPQNIVKAEYLIDTDTGFGLGTDIPLTPATDLTNLSATVNIGSLAPAAHNLMVRSLNTEGEWSLTSVTPFGIDPTYPTAPAPIGNITRIEYFFDTDPGFGMATAATITPATEIANLDINAGLGGLSAGAHKFFIRCLDDWSLTSVKEVVLPADVLPLTLLSFTGKSTEYGNELRWKTANEKNFSHFEIQRSTNSHTFENLGEKNSNELQNYLYFDSNLPAGAGWLYRLKMVDLDGSYSYSKIIIIENKMEKSIVGNFYPNPSHSNFSIEINALESGSWNISTFDLFGKKVNSETKFLQKGKNIISIDKLNKGMNFVRFENGKVSKIRKIVIQ